MPLADDSPGASLEYFCRGLRDEIVHALTSIKALRVLAARAGRTADARSRAIRRSRTVHHRRRAIGARSRARHDSSRRWRERLLPVVGIDGRGAGRSAGRHRKPIAKIVADKVAPEVDTDGAPAPGVNPTISPRATCTCRAATTSINAPRKACKRPSTSSRRRSSKTRSFRWRTAVSPTRRACSPITACSVPPTCGPRRRRARRRR